MSYFLPHAPGLNSTSKAATMAIWLIRAGSHGEHEQKFIQDNKVYLTWDEFNLNLAKLDQRVELTKIMSEHYPESKPKAISNWVSQIWPFAHQMQKGDLVVMPLKSQPQFTLAKLLATIKSKKVVRIPTFTGAA